jgi:hypothetical protein
VYLEQYEEDSHKVEVLVGASHVVSSAGLRNHHLARRSLPVKRVGQRWSRYGRGQYDDQVCALVES